MQNKPGSPYPSPEELQRLLPGYEVLELISTGKSGALYRAQQSSLEREVSIRVLAPALVKDGSQRKAFEADAKSMAKLNHPNLANVYDSGDIEGMPYLVMERIPGRTLHQTTGGHAADQMEGALLVIDLCHGLEHAHKAGIIHQAINPHHIVINKNAEAKILDFGIAGLTGLNPADGSSAYCAPEVFAEAASIDARADIYSVGMIFYELLVGHLPGDPYTPPSKASDSHPDFDRIVLRAIEHDPARRYGSAGEMAQDIENLINKWKSASSQNTTHKMRTTPLESLNSLATGAKAVKPSNLPAVAVTLLVVCTIATAAYFVIKPTLEKSGAEITATNSADTADDLFQPRPEDEQAQPPEEAAAEPTPPVVLPAEEAQPEAAEGPEPGGETVNEPVSKPVAAPDLAVEEEAPPVKPEPPEFDLDAYLATERKIIREKGKQIMDDYGEELSDNIDRFERKVKRVIRKTDREFRKAKQLAADEAFAMYRVDGRLPDVPHADVLWELRELYPEALEDQQKVDLEFENHFIKLRMAYNEGLEAKLRQLQQQGNQASADELKEEILHKLEDIGHFVEILRTQDADE